METIVLHQQSSAKYVWSGSKASEQCSQRWDTAKRMENEKGLLLTALSAEAAVSGGTRVSREAYSSRANLQHDTTQAQGIVAARQPH